MSTIDGVAHPVERGVWSVSDMLVKLYELGDDWDFLASQAELGIIIRRPIGPEKHLIVDWVNGQFGDAWASEVDIAASSWPMTCFVAVKEESLIGFACYDTTGLGFFGPIGVEPSSRGQGTGSALLRACLLDMKLKGYGYAIIGQTDVFEFYGKVVGAVEIPDSSLSVWNNWLRR